MARHQHPNRKRLGAALRRFSEAGSIDGRARVLRQYPELLALETDTFLSEIEVDLRRRGVPQEADALARSREFFGRCRQHGIEKASEQDRVNFCHIGTIAYQRYLRKGRKADLDMAINLLEQAYNGYPEEFAQGPACADNLSAAYCSRYEQSGKKSDLDRAIALAEKAVASSRSEPEKSERLINLASALLRRSSLQPSNTDLDRAIDLLVAAERTLPRLEKAWLAAAHNLAGALRQRAKSCGNLDDICKAIELHADAAKAVQRGTPEALLYQGGLANAYWQRFTQTAHLDDLEAAVTIYRIALNDAEPQSPERARLLNNLGVALSTRYDIGFDLSALDESIRCFRESLKVLPPGAPAIAGTLVNLGSYLAARYGHTGKDEDYDEAIQRLSQAEACTEGTELAGILDNQAGARWTRFDLHGGLDDLDAAITLWERALKLQDVTALKFDRQRNLAAALSQRHLRCGFLQDLERAQSLFARSVNMPSANPETELRTALNWGHWAFDRAAASEASATPDYEAWREAARAFEIARAAADRRLQIQITRRHQATWIAQAQSIPPRHAYALFKSGQPERAVEALEAGRSIFLTEALERNRADLEQLARIGKGYLLDRYRAAVTAMQLSELDIKMPDDVLRVSAHNVKRLETSEQLQACIAEIRSIPDFEDFLRPLSFAEVKSAAISAPLVYLVTTSAGGLALIVSEHGVNAIALPCTLRMLQSWLLADTSDGEPSGYLLVTVVNQSGLRGTLGRILPEMGDQLIKPIAEALRDLLHPPPDQKPLVRLVPTGLLTLLPLHAASYVTVQAASSILLDEFTVSYLPSARVCRRRRSAEAQLIPDRALVAVGDPAPLPEGLEPLRYARFEAAAVSAVTPNSFPPLLGEDASAEAVRARWNDADMAHFACHGVFEMSSPLQSALILARDKFTLGQILTELVNGRGPRHVVLSACQTALTEFVRLPEEVIGLPVGLIQAGADTVIGSLWSVNDWSTSLLMAKYAVERCQCTSSAALCKAQIWLRDSSPAELEHFVEELCRLVPPSEADTIQAQVASLTLRPGDGPPPFDDPYYWAGFGCWGAG
jgi:CHAT domain-containing protein/tetratricopeptide (TPR) repeat protein